jgi:hypothetical protein
MPNLRYKDHYISVFHMPDKVGGFSCTPCVEIRHKLDSSPTTRLVFEESFSTGHAATEHGFAHAKQWIDVNAAQKHPGVPVGVAPQTAGESQPVRVGFRAWLASLVM